MSDEPLRLPLILPLGDQGLLVRFGDGLSEPANAAAIVFAGRASSARIPGVLEIAPNLVSVLLRYDARATNFCQLAGEVRLLVSAAGNETVHGTEHEVQVAFDGEDVAEVSGLLGLEVRQFIAAHCARPLRVLATGFAPGFVYCGFHQQWLHVPRRATVRRQVPAGMVLFAAGQTAITSTPIPTGWHVIGRTGFRNFDPEVSPPTRLAAGDRVRFEALS